MLISALVGERFYKDYDSIIKSLCPACKFLYFIYEAGFTFGIVFNRLVMDIIHTIIAVQSWSTTFNLNLLATGYGLFGVSPLFILMFIVKLLLLFAVSAFISKILKLDRYYDDSHKQTRPD